MNFYHVRRFNSQFLTILLMTNIMLCDKGIALMKVLKLTVQFSVVSHLSESTNLIIKIPFPEDPKDTFQITYCW